MYIFYTGYICYNTWGNLVVHMSGLCVMKYSLCNTAVPHDDIVIPEKDDIMVISLYQRQFMEI